MKTIAGLFFVVLVLVAFSNCAIPDPDSPRAASAGEPKLEITSFPPYGSGNVVYGYLTNGTTSLYKICCWINVGSGWWPKNTYVNWNITIPTNGFWAYNFYSYPTDVNAWRLIFYLLPIDYPTYADIYTLARDSITYTVLNRYDVAYGAAPQVTVTNASNGVLMVYYVRDYTNLVIPFRASDDYYLDGVGIVQGDDDRYFQYYKTEKTTIFTQVTNVEIAYGCHTGTNIFRYYAKDQGYHYSATNTLTVICPPFKLPEATCDALLSPYLFTSPYTMTGTANADTEIVAVYAFTNGLPITVTGTTNWSAVITTETGNPTLLTVYCVDIYGVSSLTQSTLVHYGLGGWDR